MRRPRPLAVPAAVLALALALALTAAAPARRAAAQGPVAAPGRGAVLVDPADAAAAAASTPLGPEGPQGIAIPEEPTEAETYQEFDSQTNLDNSYWNLYRCMGVDMVPDDDCWADGTEEDRTRQDVQSNDRWLRSGLLAAVQLWNAFQYAKDIYRSSTNIWKRMDAIVKGFNARRPSQTVLRMRSAVDSYDRSIRRAENIAGRRNNEADDHYDRVDALVQRALGTAKDANQQGEIVGDQAGSMQARLGETTTLSIGGAEGGVGAGALPPLDDDVKEEEPAAMGFYDGMGRQGFYAAGVMQAALPPQFVNGPQAVGGQVCQVRADTLGMNDPSVLFDRVRVMAKGAQTITFKAVAEVEQTQAEVTATQEMEYMEDEDDGWTILLLALYGI